MRSEPLLLPEEAAWCRAALGVSAELALRQVRLETVEHLLTQEDAAIRPYLSAAEGQRLGSFSLAKRRREWLGGRLAAKAAAAALLLPADQANEPDWQAWEVDNQADGQPWLRSRPAGAPAGRCHLSITHQGGLAAALAAPHPCGLDLQQSLPSVLRIQHRFSAPAERLLLGLTDREPAHVWLERLTLLWAAKEAAFKAICCSPPAGFLELQLAEATGDPATGLLLRLCHCRKGSRHFVSVAAFVKQGYCYGLTVVT